MSERRRLFVFTFDKSSNYLHMSTVGLLIDLWRSMASLQRVTSSSAVTRYRLYLICKLHFLPARRYASAGYSDRNLSVCLSVRVSRAGSGIVSKRRKLAA